MSLDGLLRLPKVTEYKPAFPARDFSQLADEMEVGKAAQALVMAAQNKAVPYNDALSELAMEIDDMAYFNSTPAAKAYEDPFYWNDDYLL